MTMIPLKVSNILTLDSCQWGEWSSVTKGCDKDVCGPQSPITRRRKATDKHGNTCKSDGRENVTCPLNECLGKQIKHTSLKPIIR